jgi:hypothetical protein
MLGDGIEEVRSYEGPMLTFLGGGGISLQSMYMNVWYKKLLRTSGSGLNCTGVVVTVLLINT